MSKNLKMLVLTIFVGLVAFIYFGLNKAPIQRLSGTIEATPAPQATIMENTQELVIEDLVVGTGAEAKSGSLITVNYSGTLLNGTKFDSSYDRGVPFSFTLGVGEVIAGWDQGFNGMKVGGKRKLTIPSHLAYGEQGSGDTIGPNSTLVFEVELIEVK